MDAVELLLHPVRLRIVHALGAERALTTAQLSRRMPDVGKVTVYRHVALLAEGGFLEVDGEQRVRGAVERRYRLRPDRPSIGTADAAAMSLEDHRRAFAAAMAALIGEFGAYLDREGTDPIKDAVTYRQATLWLTPDERSTLGAQFLNLLRPHLTNPPGGPRTPYLLSTILFPTEQHPPEPPPP